MNFATLGKGLLTLSYKSGLYLQFTKRFYLFIRFTG